MEETLLTVREVAKYFKKSENSIRYNMPDLPYIMIGGNKRFRMSDIKKYEEKHTYKGNQKSRKD